MTGENGDRTAVWGRAGFGVALGSRQLREGQGALAEHLMRASRTVGSTRLQDEACFPKGSLPIG